MWQKPIVLLQQAGNTTCMNFESNAGWVHALHIIFNPTGTHRSFLLSPARHRVPLRKNM
jgi:hypothetical protein